MFTVTSTQARDGRWAYSVNGTKLTTRRTRYALAVCATGNPYREDGLYLNLTNSYAQARKHLATFPGSTLVDIETP